jgi:malic enzyme
VIGNAPVIPPVLKIPLNLAHRDAPRLSNPYAKPFFFLAPGCPQTAFSRTKLVTNEMLVAAVEGVASIWESKDDLTAPLLPGVDIVRRVSVRVARNVIKAAVKGKVSQQADIPEDDQKLDKWIEEKMWQAEYRPLKLKK